MGKAPPEQHVIDAIQNDAAKGELSTNQIAEKHSVCWMTAKKYAGGAANGQNGRKAATKNAPAKNGHAPSNGSKISIEISASIADAIWDSLPLETKARLLVEL